MFCMFVLEWLHYIIAWCVSHMFQVMANGETFGRSILSPHPSTPSSCAKPSRATPNRSQSTPKTSLYRRLSARLSGRRTSPTKHSADTSTDRSQDERETRLLQVRNSVRDKQVSAKDQPDDYSINLLEKSFTGNLCSQYDKSPSHVELRKYNVNDKENKDASKVLHGSLRINVKDKREVFRNKSMNVFNLVDCLTEAGSLHSSVTKSLCDLDSKDEPDFLLPNSTDIKELQKSNTTISSGKKRSRNSTDSNLLVNTIDITLSPDKCDDSNWKSIKRLKIKDSFKFKNKPTIFKKNKKESVSKTTTGDIIVEPVSPDSVKPTDPAGEYVASTSSPVGEDDNTSICSMNTSKQSGFFEISFASLRSSKTVKSASKLRRSVKSFTASFRTERKKKYEKRAGSNSGDIDICHLASDLKNVSTPKTELDEMKLLDISPVQVDTVDSTDLGTTPNRRRGCNIDELDDSLIFKTPQSVWLRAHRHSVCGGVTELRNCTSTQTLESAPSPVFQKSVARNSPLLVSPPAAIPSSRQGREKPQPASTSPLRDARAISQCHGLSLPVLTPFYSVILKLEIAFHAI